MQDIPVLFRKTLPQDILVLFLKTGYAGCPRNRNF